MAKTRVLITVKTYPTISKKYDELVCTAGVTEDGKWVRIYPIPFRILDYVNQYKKYEWVEVDIVKNKSDFRPESYRLVNIDVENPIKVVGKIDTNNNWQARKDIVLKKVYNNMEELINEAKNKNICTSLAVFKPNKIIDFVWEEVERDWDKNKTEKLKQLNLFKDNSKFEVVKKLPYKFSYKFEGVDGIERKLMIEDWEVGALYWNLFNKHKDEIKACEDVKKKYFDDFAKTKDLHFFLGTAQVHHFVGKNPFMIIGAFYPKKDIQLKFDFEF
jgi:hypothetical protein